MKTNEGDVYWYITTVGFGLSPSGKHRHYGGIDLTVISAVGNITVGSLNVTMANISGKSYTLQMEMKLLIGTQFPK